MSARRHRRDGTFHEPSLVPLADMLTNTVGIVVFILIFTVLTAGGVAIAKVLPVERDVRVESTEYWVCMSGRVFPLRAALIGEATKHDAAFERSREGFASLAQSLDGRVASDADLTLRVRAALADDPDLPVLDLEITCEAVDGGGSDASEIGRGEGVFIREISRVEPRKTALIFWVRPDGIAAYRAARDGASRAGVASNWLPRDPDRPISFRLGGGLDGPITVQSGR